MAAVNPLSMDAVKVPPHSIEAEQAVLGGLMLSSDAWDRVADVVAEDDFYRQDHRLIFRAIASLHERGTQVDAITLGEWLENNDLAQQAGGSAYVASLANNTPGASNIANYSQIVREKSILRQLIQVSHDIAENCFQPEGQTTQELLEHAEENVFAIRDKGGRQQSGFIHIREGVTETFKLIGELMEYEGSITGVPTGFKKLDEMTAGLQKSDLIIVAGRPAMGKTTLALNIAEHAAMSHDPDRPPVPVAIFSMEMSSVQLIMRLLSSLARVNQHKLRTGDFKEDDSVWPRLTSAMTLLNDTQIFLDETPGLSPTELRARARRIDAQLRDAEGKGGLGLIVIDYLQLMQVPGNKENRATEIAEISRALKALAKELNVPVVALSQLNRSLEQRPNKRPVMADLRESGSIEQDADVIIFIYRDEVYNEDSPDKGKAEIIIGKHRNGDVGTVNLTFLGQYTRFENFAPDSFAADYGGEF
ncbi:MAG: replicative DNA helicase [Xanthomonadales bacterium]|nr:replicative DNA helicase [Xanthomonadales bacterium]